MDNNLLFIDTSAFFSFFDRTYSEHFGIRNKMQISNYRFVSTNYIVDELITLFRGRGISFDKFKPFIENIWNEKICILTRITSDIDSQAWQFMEKYKDHPFSFTDCPSFIIMKRMGIERVCTLDHHFLIAGLEII